ncbi:TetR/AcrR family transcriptional regulator [Actinomycetospora straminea]|uniref:TetR/AcrR family transcriptional regulator n=1 Tax=Actinomycetospora straminea TaxID=663607 RepID=A0ABP9F7P7_9PSEU|nr:TetR/AcrR family transcriptional regulator [Actinomycetospora straminea]MDD7934755.1 TetR/AcrR family transcriptional regulator [Actinomycetospora straminea]
MTAAPTPPSPPPRRDAGRPRGATIVAAVLAAVRAELAETGFEGLSVERVARRAEVNKTSVYRRWPTREALVAAAMEGLLEEFGASPDTGSLRGDLHALAAPIAELAARPDGVALLRAALATTAPGDVRGAARQRVGPPVASASSIVDRARARGEWRDGADPQQAVFTLVGAIVHRTLLEHADPTGEWLDGLVDLVHRGVSADPPP